MIHLLFISYIVVYYIKLYLNTPLFVIKGVYIKLMVFWWCGRLNSLFCLLERNQHLFWRLLNWQCFFQKLFSCGFKIKYWVLRDSFWSKFSHLFFSRFTSVQKLQTFWSRPTFWFFNAKDFIMSTSVLFVDIFYCKRVYIFFVLC